MLVVYRFYWMALNSLFYLSEVYDIAAKTVCASIGVPTGVIILLSVLLPLSLLDLLLSVQGRVKSMIVFCTLLPAASEVAEADKFLDLSVTCLFAPIQEEVFFRLIPGLIVAAPVPPTNPE